jgi:DNA-binding transcriptional MerR regulator
MEKLLSTAEAARILGLVPQTLRIWRSRGGGPAYVRYGGPRGRVYYHPEDLNKWLEDRKAENTSEETVRDTSTNEEVSNVAE